MSNDNDSKVVPFKEGMAPTLDIERELIEFCMSAIKQHVAEHGEPQSIALALIAPELPGKTSTTSIWAPREETTGTRIAAFASVLFTRRAIRGYD